MTELLLYLLTGACAGTLSGLLGVGGGILIVPALALLLAPHHFPESHLMHVALGTSLATIVFTAAAASKAHQRRGSINVQAARGIAPGVIGGTLLGAWLAAHLPSDALKVVFVLFSFYAGTQLLLDYSPPPGRSLPGNIALLGAGGVIGALSSLVGIGGGSLSVPFLVRCRCPMREAIGTSSLIGLPLAIAGTAGYVFMGRDVAGLPQYSLGFIYLPALGGIAVASMLTAPFGAALAHR
ncbi:MAG: sulfite exporter TauE/SafE family protein, partial [Methylobacterium sp.]|nr:sulfite exporter TauE/SafE family protein [Methylobacterium sp.]